MTVLRQRIADPWTVSMAAAAGLVATGFVAITLGWQGLAAQEFVPLQLPFGVSGGIAGLGLVGSGLALLAVQTDRRLAAAEHANLDALTRKVSCMVTSLAEARADGVHRELKEPRAARGPTA